MIFDIHVANLVNLCEFEGIPIWVSCKDSWPPGATESVADACIQTHEPHQFPFNYQFNYSPLKNTTVSLAASLQLQLEKRASFMQVKLSPVLNISRYKKEGCTSKTS